jgi:hypothetical protein
MRSEVRAGRGGKACGTVWRRKWHARGEAPTRGGPDSGLGGQGEHPEHGAHVRDLGGVSKVLSGWLNTFAPCRVEEGAYTMQSEVRAGRREGVEQYSGTSGVHGEGPTQGLGVRARAERTENMELMLVTLEVSKLLSGWLIELAPNM